LNFIYQLGDSVVIAVESIILAAIIKEWRKGNAATIIYKRTNIFDSKEGSSRIHKK
jgi:hypothetical protein